MTNDPVATVNSFISRVLVWRTRVTLVAWVTFLTLVCLPRPKTASRESARTDVPAGWLFAHWWYLDRELELRQRVAMDL